MLNAAVFQDLDVKKADFYLKLSKESLLTVDVIKNLRYSRLPSDADGIDHVIAIYRYAVKYKVDAHLNTHDGGTLYVV